MSGPKAAAAVVALAGLAGAEESYPRVPRSGLFPLEVALTGAAAGEGSSGNGPLIVGLTGGGVLALAMVAALLLPRLRSP